MPFEQNQLFGMGMYNNGAAQGGNFVQGGNQVVGQQQYQQGQVNNYVNHTSSVGNAQAVENVNYYDTYHHRVNNYHTMNTNRYRDHYIDHNVYYNNRRNVYDGADYHTTSSYVVEQPTYAASGATAGANAGANAGAASGTISGIRFYPGDGGENGELCSCDEGTGRDFFNSGHLRSGFIYGNL